MRIWILCLLLIGSGLGSPAWGQATTPVGNPLKELRAALAPLDATRIPTGFLLNRVMLFTDPTRFAGQGDTAASYRGFEQQYWEYYHAALDTTNLLTLDSLRAMTARRVQQQNELPLLMLSYRYNVLVASAAQDQLITIDSVNALVTDGPDRSRSPYDTEHLFSVVLALPAVQGTVDVYVGPEYWLGNVPAPDVLYIDFGDGNGVQTVPMGSTVQVTVGNSSRPPTSSPIGPHPPAGPPVSGVGNGQGTVVFTATSTTGSLRLPTNAWPNGLYQVQMRQAKTVKTRQLSVQH